MHITEALSHLPPAVARLTFHTLITALPPPVTGAPEDRAARDEAAIAAVAALQPADAFEARLAAHIVAADAQAMECLRLAGQPARDANAAFRCRAQAATMMRLMQSALRQLRRDQAAREKAEAAMHPAAMERAGYWFREVQAADPDPTEPGPTAPDPTAPDPLAEPDPLADIAAEADLYVAVIYPQRAALIRRLGRLPDKPDFGPPRPALVDAIVTGTSPALRALDAAPPHEPRRLPQTEFVTADAAVRDE